jgi:hypothetical protein
MAQQWFEQRGDGFIIQGGTPEPSRALWIEVVPLLQARGLFRRDYPGTTLRESGLALPANQFQNNKKNVGVRNTLLAALAPPSWAQDVKINGTGVSLEANKTPIHTAKSAGYRPAANFHWRCRGIYRRGGR